MASDVNRPPTPLYGFKVYTITPRADTVITSQSNKNEHGQRKSVKFKVDSTSLQAISDYFRASFHFNNKFKHKIVLKDDDPDALRVWLIYLHASAERGIVVNGELKIPRQVRRRLFQRLCVNSTGVSRLWNIGSAADKYQLDLTILKGFFTTWFHRNVNLGDERIDLDFIRNMVPLCYFFNHIEGFAAVTKYLVYNYTEPMTEILQSGKEWEHEHLYTPKLDGIVDRARGLLISTLEEVLITKAFGATTPARDRRQYFLELERINVIPQEMKNSKIDISTLLSRLQMFNMDQSGGGRMHYVQYVQSFSKDAMETFNGLCMDCMAREPSSHDDLYTEHLNIQRNGNGHYDTPCRIKHDRITWYVSRCRPDDYVRESNAKKWLWDGPVLGAWWYC